MSDIYTIEQRHNNMAAIRGKDTKPEMIVRQYLWSSGFRYRLNHPRLPGKPDIVLRRYRTCIFVNGCFWHGHGIADANISAFENLSDRASHAVCLDLVNSKCCKIPHTNREFWVKKITRNMERDIEVKQKLKAMGWYCITIWECQLKGNKRERTLRSLVFTLSHLFLKDHSVKCFDSAHHKLYDLPEETGYSMVAEDSTDFYNSKQDNR